MISHKAFSRYEVVGKPTTKVQRKVVGEWIWSSRQDRDWLHDYILSSLTDTTDGIGRRYSVPALSFATSSQAPS